MPNLILSTAYAPPVEHCALLFAYGAKALIEQHEHYIKQSFRNRCHIVGGEGIVSLSIPVEQGANKQCPVREVRISDHDRWQRQHWNTITTCYGSAPFFEYYAPDLQPLLTNQAQHAYLFDYNNALLEGIWHLLHLPQQWQFTEQYGDPTETHNLTHQLQPKQPWPFSHYSPIPYYQPFEQQLGFTPHLSILDLLFNMGPESALVLQRTGQQLRALIEG